MRRGRNCPRRSCSIRPQGDIRMEPKTVVNKATESPPINSNDFVTMFNDLLLRLQRIELALAAAPAVEESPRRREIERRRGYTTQDVARVLRCSSDSVRTMVRSGRLGAVNMRNATSGKPRFIVMPEHLAAFIEANKVYVPPKPERRRRRSPEMIDYFPETWEEYERQVDRHAEKAKSINRPDGRNWGPRGRVRTYGVDMEDDRVDDRRARATRRGRAQFCPKTWDEYDSIIRRHPGLKIFVVRPDGKTARSEEH